MNPDEKPDIEIETSSFLREIPLPLEEAPPTRVGGFRILRVLGEGGMGTVYEAEQEATRRFVALKLVHPHLATPRYRRRFAEEIRTLGKFEHAGIARIHDAGAAPDDRGALRLYFAMELVAGARVDEHVSKHASWRDPSAAMDLIASLMVAICEGVHHAHQKGVIHCDLKPANILVGADGSPKILDFGIARIIGDEIRETSILEPGSAAGHGGILGTLSFASPEQAAGDRNRLDVLTDVYGLGAVLHALVAGTPPHGIAGCSLAEAARIARDVPPPRLRTRRPECPVEIETIAAKAMAPIPRDRYDSAAAMALDLRRFLDGRPILARRAPWSEVAAKWVRRNRIAAAAIVVASLAMLAGVVGVTITLARLRGALQQVHQEARDHERTRHAVQGSLLSADERHQRSRAFTASLQSDEMAGTSACVLMAADWNKDKLPAQADLGRFPDRLLTLDERGDVVDRLDLPRTWPIWARPSFDVGRRFDHGLGVPQESTTIAALVDDLDGDFNRDLVRSLYIHNEHLHLAVLETDTLGSVVRSRGAATASTSQLWSHGNFIDIAWDPRRRLVWCLADADELPYFAPELEGCDSAGCPVGLETPRLLVALEASDLRAASGRGAGRVLPPLLGDAAHPPVRPVWAFSMRAPASMRDDDGDRRSVADMARVGGTGGVVQIQLQAFQPRPIDGAGDGLGTLLVTFRYAERNSEVIASVELDATGAPIGPFRLEPIPHREVSDATRALVARTDPAKEIVALDLGALSAARPTAEGLLREHHDRSEAMRRLDTMSGLAPSERRSIAGCIDAMTSNWRWLNNSAGEIIEREEIVDRLGADADIGTMKTSGTMSPPPYDDASLAEVRMALRRIEEAKRLHADRCPAHGDGSCVCEWFIESKRALALAALGEWNECRGSAQRALDALAVQRDLDQHDAANRALLAIALHALGESDAADAALAVAEEDLAAMAASSKSPQGSGGELAPRLCARASGLIRAQ